MPEGAERCLQAACASEDHTVEMFSYGQGMSLSPQGSQSEAEACECTQEAVLGGTLPSIQRTQEMSLTTSGENV